jgi:hypothetical protein
MASLQRVRVQGRSYWRIVESRRMNGNPHAIPILHRGTADQLLNRLLSAPQSPLRIYSCTQPPELMAITSTQYTPLGKAPLEGLLAYRTREIWEVERPVVLFISPKLRAGQLRGVNHQLNKRLQALAEWKQRLAQPRSGPRPPQKGHQQAESLQRGRYIKDILKVHYERDQPADLVHR